MTQLSLDIWPVIAKYCDDLELFQLMRLGKQIGTEITKHDNLFDRVLVPQFAGCHKKSLEYFFKQVIQNMNKLYPLCQAMQHVVVRFSLVGAAKTGKTSLNKAISENYKCDPKLYEATRGLNLEQWHNVVPGWDMHAALVSLITFNTYRVRWMQQVGNDLNPLKRTTTAMPMLCSWCLT